MFLEGSFINVVVFNATFLICVFGMWISCSDQHPFSPLATCIRLWDIRVISFLGLVALIISIIIHDHPSFSQVPFFIAASIVGVGGIRVRTDNMNAYPALLRHVAPLIFIIGIMSSFCAVALFASIATGGNATVLVTLIVAALLSVYCLRVQVIGEHPFPHYEDTFPIHFFGVVGLICGIGTFAHVATAGNIWTTLFGRTVVAWMWMGLMTRLSLVLSTIASSLLQFSVVGGIVFAIHRRGYLDRRKSYWLATSLFMTVLASEFRFLGANSDYDGIVHAAGT